MITDRQLEKPPLRSPTRPMNITWVGGWAIPPKEIVTMAHRLRPKDHHTIVYPGEYWQAHLPTTTDVFIGHSLGAFLLLCHCHTLRTNARILLAAPFCDFRAESQLGGCVRTVQLKFLLKMLAGRPLDAIRDFYQRAGLEAYADEELPYGITDLVWGIRQLLETAAPIRAFNRVQQSILGSEDRLINAEKYREICPDIHILEGAGHALKDLAPHLCFDHAL